MKQIFIQAVSYFRKEGEMSEPQKRIVTLARYNYFIVKDMRATIETLGWEACKVDTVEDIREDSAFIVISTAIEDTKEEGKTTAQPWIDIVAAVRKQYPSKPIVIASHGTPTRYITQKLKERVGATCKSFGLEATLASDFDPSSLDHFLVVNTDNLKNQKDYVQGLFKRIANVAVAS